MINDDTPKIDKLTNKVQDNFAQCIAEKSIRAYAHQIVSPNREMGCEILNEDEK